MFPVLRFQVGTMRWRTEGRRKKRKRKDMAMRTDLREQKQPR